MGKPAVKVKDNGWNRALKAFAKVAGSRKVAVGVRDGKRKHPGSDLTYNQIMAIHEFGAPAAGVPERAPIRRAFDANRAKYERILFRAVGDVLDGKTTPDAELEVLGATMADDIRAGIRASLPPPLKAATVARKRRRGSPTPTLPLVDTGALIEAIDYEVRRK